MSADPRPTHLALPRPDRLRITWSDGLVQEFSVAELRRQCPCATCREKRQAPPDPLALPILSPADLAPLALLGMQPVGNYAYALRYSDGHDSGIYRFDFLRAVGQEVPAAGQTELSQ